MTSRDLIHLVPDTPPSAVSKAVEVLDGAIYWRGSWKSIQDADRLACEFERIACLPDDWFHTSADQYAADLRWAIREVESQYA